MFNRFDRRFAYGFQGGSGERWSPPWLQEDDNEWHGPRRGAWHRGPRGQFGRGPWGPEHHGHHGHYEHHEHHHGPFGQGPWHRGPFGHGPWGFGPGAWGQGAPWFFGMRRRGPFGPEGPFGGPEGPAGRGRRFFGRGDMKFALLALLQERPMHGYEMMKALEEKSGGFYAPSAGSIYPTLQMLEDRGLVTANEVEGKKVYSITDAGRALLNERQNTEGQDEFSGPQWGRGPWGRHHGGPREGFAEMQTLRGEAMELARLFAIAGRLSFNNPDRLAQLRSIIERTRQQLAEMIAGAGTNAQASADAPSETPTGTNAQPDTDIQQA